MAKKQTIVKKGDKNEKKRSLAELVTRLIDRCLEAIENKKVKVSVSDLIRMRNFRQELAPEEPESREAIWVDDQD
jgi:phenylpyruvate tautomerase PptA (4-oxalocrotonate tautomerase family)